MGRAADQRGVAMTLCEHFRNGILNGHRGALALLARQNCHHDDTGRTYVNASQTTSL